MDVRNGERDVERGADPLLSSHRPTTTTALIEATYAEHVDRLRGLSAAITLDRSTSAEIVHDAFAGLARNIDHVRDPVAYLQRSVINLSVRAIRRRERARQLPLEPVGHHVTPEIDEMWDRVADLPAAQRAIVVLRFWEDLSYEQISQVLDVPLGTVQSRMHRALRALREEIG